MNKEEFLAALAETREEWDLGYNKILRSGSNMCPITVVCKMKTGLLFESVDYKMAAEKLNIDPNLADDIIFASDYTLIQLPVNVRLLRRKILKVLGVNE